MVPRHCLGETETHTISNETLVLLSIVATHNAAETYMDATKNTDL